MEYLRNRTLAVSLILGAIAGLMAPMQRTTGATILGDQGRSDIETSIQTSIRCWTNSKEYAGRDRISGWPNARHTPTGSGACA